jgi:serine/threonine-protein kinase
MGSPAYMSPEQMRSSKLVDVRSDLWALGVILYQSTTGHVPFAAETFTELCLRVAMDPTPAMPNMPYAVPPGFEAVVRRCLEKDPAQRMQNVAELAQMLVPFGPYPQSGQMAERVGRVLLGESAAQMMFQSNPELSGGGVRVPTTLGGSSGQIAKKRRSKAPLIGGLILTLGGVAGIVAAVTTSGGNSTGKPAVPTAPAQPATQPPPPAPEPAVKPVEVKIPEVKLPEPPPPEAPTPPPEEPAPPPVAEKPADDEQKAAEDKKRREREKDRERRKSGGTSKQPDKPPEKAPDKPKPTIDPLANPD